MSLFGSLLRDFDDDVFGFHREQLHRMGRMMNSFDSMFGGFGGFPSLMASPYDDHHHHHSNSRSLMPFGFGQSIFPSMSSMFSDLEQMNNDPNCHVFSSSSVMTYSSDGGNCPTVYQSTSSTRTAPGGVKETRRTISDSTTGIHRMSIGHHLGERSHIIERTQNRNTGEHEESQEFINIEEEEASSFNNEWQNRTSHNVNVANKHPRIQHRYENDLQQPLAITAGPSSVNSQERHSRKRENRSNAESDKNRKSQKHKHNSRTKHDLIYYPQD